MIWSASTGYTWHFTWYRSHWYTPFIIKPVKRFQMKSTECRDFQHTGHKAYKQEGNIATTTLVRLKQDAQTRASSNSQTSLHQWLHCMSNNLVVFSICCNLELISISYNCIQFVVTLSLNWSISYNYQAVHFALLNIKLNNTNLCDSLACNVILPDHVDRQHDILL